MAYISAFYVGVLAGFFGVGIIILTIDLVLSIIKEKDGGKE